MTDAAPRSSNRHTISLAVTVTAADQVLDGTTENLSLGGTCVALTERLAMGTKVTVSLPIPGPTKRLEIDGEVRWTTGGVTGIQFGSLRARAVWELNQYFEALPR